MEEKRQGEAKGKDLTEKHEEQIDYKLEKKEYLFDNGSGFYRFLFFGIIPIIVTTILLIKTIIMYISIRNIDDMELINVIIDSNWMDIGFSIISIAVSVWLGINIANLVDKKRIDELSHNSKKLENEISKSADKLKTTVNVMESLNEDIKNKIDGINDNIEQRFYKTKFFDKLMKVTNLYESASYIHDEFEDNERANYKDLDRIEEQYLKCSMAYEENKWEDTYECSKKGIFLLEDLNKKEKYYEKYYNIRKSDFLFYKNMAITHNSDLGTFSKDELLESISLYENVLQEIGNDSNTSLKFKGYLYNTIGYTYDILNVHSRSEEDKMKYSSLSEVNMNRAVKCNEKGRYYRNLGLVYEHMGDLGKAKNTYRKAFREDPRDYKAYNNILSIILKELDKLYRVNERFDSNILMSELNTTMTEDKSSLHNELLEIDKYRGFAEVSNCWFEDIQFNICKMYMYFYIFSDYAENKYIECAIDYGKKAMFLNKGSNGAKFSLRNAYECYNKIEEAKEINSELKGAGDSAKAAKLYQLKSEDFISSTDEI